MVLVVVVVVMVVVVGSSYGSGGGGDGDGGGDGGDGGGGVVVGICESTGGPNSGSSKSIGPIGGIPNMLPQRCWTNVRLQ